MKVYQAKEERTDGRTDYRGGCSPGGHTNLGPALLRKRGSPAGATPRLRGHRRYDASIFELLAILRMAQQADFTIAEMHQLVAGFSPETPASERWQFLVQKKLQEVEATIAHAQQTKQRLEQLSHCGCLHLKECVHRNAANQPVI